MKKFTVILLTVLTLATLLLTSCSAKTVTVRVIDGEGTTICEETVKLGEDNPNSVQGVTYYGLDCLEAALTQAGIEYYVNKEDYEAFAVTNIGDIASDKTNQFVYYVKENSKSDFVDKSGLSAQHDEMVGGEILEFRFESIEK
ncbi:MAG: hypothetical protein IKL05_02755 [Clostridia bacterium]|nr:hypothetical protein [Clostridia bacterium]